MKPKSNDPPESVTCLSLDQFTEWIKEKGHPTFRAKQIFEWLYQHRVGEYSEMTNLSIGLREALVSAAPLFSSKVNTTQHSSDGTIKILIELHDGEKVETVMIPEGKRRTVCVSSQVGCGMGCVFCASGLYGMKRQLSAGEIIEQVLHIRRAMDAEERVSNIVFMGMGEPLANYRNLDLSIRAFQAEWGCGIGKRHMTVSTVGLLPRAKKLAEDHPQVTLAISLHGPNNKIRNRVVPTTPHLTVDDLIMAARDYFKETHRKPTFEYCMIGNLNSAKEHARELAFRLRGLECYVNLIPLNPVDEIPLDEPARDEVNSFAAILREQGIEVAIRRRRGADIDAACGQLKLKAESQGFVERAAVKS
jgi:23S rRNA (adenine2503-C2)-methyltransferase